MRYTKLSQQELDFKIKDHQLWLESQQSGEDLGGEKLILTNCELKNLSFKDCVLDDAQFLNCLFSSTVFCNVEFGMVLMEDCSFFNVTFDKVYDVRDSYWCDTFMDEQTLQHAPLDLLEAHINNSGMAYYKAVGAW